MIRELHLCKSINTTNITLISKLPIAHINMTNNQPDRLDRIEATLERVSQQLDNQVVVNAELRQTTAQLTDAVNVLMTSVTTLTGVVTQHQETLETVVGEIREMRADMRSMQGNMQEMQFEIRGLQTENRRILDYLERGERG